MKATYDDQSAASSELDAEPDVGRRPRTTASAKQEGNEPPLAERIRHRIEIRLAGRIHDLDVKLSGNEVVLRGRCATFYSKQLAQHAAMGVIEQERLINAITVAVQH